MRIIDADALLEEFKSRAVSARNWKENALNCGNEEAVIRADATLAFLTEVKLTIENAPTVISDNKGYSQGFKDGKECALVSIDAIEDITDRMVSIISEIDWEKAIEAYNARPQGEWLEDSGNIACSHCHTIWLYRRADFCPHCGADMRGKEND